MASDSRIDEDKLKKIQNELEESGFLVFDKSRKGKEKENVCSVPVTVTSISSSQLKLQPNVLKPTKPKFVILSTKALFKNHGKSESIHTIRKLNPQYLPHMQAKFGESIKNKPKIIKVENNIKINLNRYKRSVNHQPMDART